MKKTYVLIAALLLAVPLNAKPTNRRGGGPAIEGIYEGVTYDSYLVFEVRADGSVIGTLDHIDWGPYWPDSYLKEHLVWGAVSGRVSGKTVILDLEYHYDFPDEDDYYLPEDYYETIELRSGKDAEGNPALIHNAGWGVKFTFTKQ
ncbi:MAG: hypothetical protein ACYTGN_12585 [Planctomycetota bacterium]|jgi:hypothetical protein